MTAGSTEKRGFILSIDSLGSSSRRNRTVFNTLISQEKRCVSGKDCDQFSYLVWDFSSRNRVHTHARCQSRISHIRTHYGADTIDSYGARGDGALFLFQESLRKKDIKKPGEWIEQTPGEALPLLVLASRKRNIETGNIREITYISPLLLQDI